MTTENAWVDRDAYPFRSRWLELPEGKLHYIDEGEGELVLFVHGTPTWSFEYRHLVRALSSGHRCIAVDHLGFGLSDRPANAAYRANVLLPGSKLPAPLGCTCRVRF